MNTMTDSTPSGTNESTMAPRFKPHAGGRKWNLLQRMRLWQKFALLAVLAVAAVSVPYVQFFKTAQESVGFAKTEISGLEPTRNAVTLLQRAQQHRGLSALMLGGNEGQSQNRAAKQVEVEQLIATLDQQLASLDSKTVKDEWAALKQDWKQLAAEVSNRSADSRKSFESHTAFSAKILRFLDMLGDHYLLTLDPTAHTYFLVQSALVHLPQLTEYLGQIRALGAGRLAEAAKLRTTGGDIASAITPTDRAKISGLIDGATETAESAYRFIAKAQEAEPKLRALLEDEKSAPQAAARQLTQLAFKEIVESPILSYAGPLYVQSFTEGIDAQFKFLNTVSAVLGSELDAYSGKLQRDRQVITAQILAVALVVALIATLTVRNITGTVASLQASVNQVRQGDYAALQDIESRDEVGDLGRTVNELLLDRVETQRKTEEGKNQAEAANERLNNSVISILQAVNQLSQRDLTARAPVTEDIIGTVSDSINALTDETTQVLHGVNLIAGEVAQGSGKVRSQSELMSKTAEDDRKSVGLMITSLADATQATNRVAALAEQSNRHAEQATQSTEAALQTVNGTVKGMESIRETIAETEKRIKRLGERSQEITGIVNLINTISERTHVLALNASMQAAVAGEAGRGFAVVAEEVQRLAESSRNASQQIGTLVNNIQLETNETIATVSRTIGQVVQGSELAQKAGEQMRHTQQITGELVAQVKRIAESSEQQKELSAGLLESVQRIGQSTERTAQQIDVQNLQTDTLLESARRLVASVGVFKLPQAT
jgi:twitching motility protein PilJ